jgi:hypothetical protein
MTEQPPAADQPEPQPPAEQPPAEQPQAEQPPAEQPQAEQPQAEQPQAEQPQADQPQADQPQADQPQADQPQADQPQGGRQRPRQRRRERRPQPRRERGPLPINELRDAARAATEAYGARRALRDAFTLLAPKERTDLSNLVAADEDHRPRARNIATGSLGAGRLGKALAAQQIAMARVEDLWTLTLSKEHAAEKLARVRGARQRDERRAQRDAERAQRSDRVSREQLAAAQDGRVGAQIRIVGPDRQERPKPKDEEPPEPKKGSSVLDRLGY